MFHVKPINSGSEQFLHKARCVVRGDFQNSGVDYDPNNPYAPVACREAIRKALGIAARNNLFVEGGDISNAYLYVNIDIVIHIVQPTESSGIEEKPGYIARLLKSMYGTKEADMIRSSF